MASAIYASENPATHGSLGALRLVALRPPQCLAALFFVGHRQGSHGVVGCAATPRPPARDARGRGGRGSHARVLVCGEALGDAQMGVSELVATAECARAPLGLEADRDQTTVVWSS